MRRPPDFLQQLGMGNDLACMADQHHQQFVLDGRKVHFLVVHEYLPQRQIDPQILAG